MKKLLGSMMDKLAFLSWAARLNLEKVAIEIIAAIRAADPVRRTEGRKNVHGRWASAKMGFTLQFESLIELARHIALENDARVREYWEQPLTLRLNYRARSGRNNGVDHTPDLMVLGDDEAWFEECKPEEKLMELSVEMPHRYVRHPDGSWTCPPGEAAAGEYGMGYRVYSSAQISHTLTRNFTFLDDYRAVKCSAPQKKTVDRVIAAVRANQGVTIPELLSSVPGLTADELYYLIANGIVYADLRHVLMVDPQGVRLFTDAAIANAMEAAKRAAGGCVSPNAGPVDLVPTAKVIVDGEVSMVGEVTDQIVQLFGSDGRSRHWKRTDLERLVFTGAVKSAAPVDARQRAAHARITAAGPEGQRIALARWNLVQPQLGSEPPPKPRDPILRRQLDRLIFAYRKAQHDYDNGFIGLLQKARVGNQKPRFQGPLMDLMKEFAEKFEDLRGKSIKSVHDDLKAECKAKRLSPPSRQSWGKFLRGRPRVAQILKRRGPRAAYQKKQFVWILDRDTPVHGDRAWEIAHIDHTELDLELLCSKTGKNLGRPWMTLMIDAFTRRILAVALSFESERTVSSMRVMRECVRRHHRLPQFLVVDQGKGHESVYFDTVLAHYDMSKKSRPAAYCRNGSVCERIFGTVNSQFIHNALGNTKITKNVREVSKSVNPKNLAVWTLEGITPFVRKYCYEVYDAIDHPALGVSPRVMMERSPKTAGERAHRLIPYDVDFYMLTLPTTKSGEATVHLQKGVHINYLDYWCQTISENPLLEGTMVPVRYDPDDASVAFVYLLGQWRLCLSSYDEVFRNWSQRAVELATEELRKRRKLVAKDRNDPLDADGQRNSESAKLLSDFLRDFEKSEALLLLSKKEFAQRAVKAVIDPNPPVPRDQRGNVPLAGAASAVPETSAPATSSDQATPATPAKPTVTDPFAAAAQQDDGSVFPMSNS